MFSEYTSRFLSQSQARLSSIRDFRSSSNNGNPNVVPLFHSAADYLNTDDEDNQDNDNDNDDYDNYNDDDNFYGPENNLNSNLYDTSLDPDGRAYNNYNNNINNINTNNSNNSNNYMHNHLNRHSNTHNNIFNSRYNNGLASGPNSHNQRVLRGGKSKYGYYSTMQETYSKLPQDDDYFSSNIDTEEHPRSVYAPFIKTRTKNKNKNKIKNKNKNNINNSDIEEDLETANDYDYDNDNANRNINNTDDNENENENDSENDDHPSPTQFIVERQSIDSIKFVSNPNQINTIDGYDSNDDSEPLESVMLNTTKQELTSNNKTVDKTNYETNADDEIDNEDDSPPHGIGIEMLANNDNPNFKSKKTKPNQINSNIINNITRPINNFVQEQRNNLNQINLFTSKPFTSHSQQQRQQQHQQQQQQQQNNIPLSSEVPEFITSITVKNNSPDNIWMKVYFGSLALMFSLAFIIWLRTDVDTKIPPKAPRKTLTRAAIYTLLEWFFPFLFKELLISIILSTLWFFLLGNYLRPMVYTTIVLVPITMIPLSIYPLYMSYRSAYGGGTLQDYVMRWMSWLPICFGLFWSYFIFYKNRGYLSRSIRVIEFAFKILKIYKFPILTLVIVLLGVFVIFVYIWLGIFAWYVLGGDSWLIASWYVFMLVWTSNILSDFMRVTLSSTVSQWYFHRHEINNINNNDYNNNFGWYTMPSSFQNSDSYTASFIVKATINNCFGSQLGSICYASFMRMISKIFWLPNIIIKLLPGIWGSTIRHSIYGAIQIFIYTFLPFAAASPNPIKSLTSGLTLSYLGATGGISLFSAARSTAFLRFIDLAGQKYTYGTRINTTNHAGSSTNNNSNVEYGNNNRIGNDEYAWDAYNLSKMIIMTCKLVGALFIGMHDWVLGARSDLIGIGSLYGYIIGILGGMIAWVVLGAIESTISMIVDSTFVCFAIDQRSNGGHCSEADALYGGC